MTPIIAGHRARTVQWRAGQRWRGSGPGSGGPPRPV